MAPDEQKDTNKSIFLSCWQSAKGQENIAEIIHQTFFLKKKQQKKNNKKTQTNLTIITLNN
jgi:hypothetical protein